MIAWMKTLAERPGMTLGNSGCPVSTTDPRGWYLAQRGQGMPRGLEGHIGIRHRRLFDLGYPFCQRVKNLLGVDRLGPQWREKQGMKHDGVICRFNFKVDPVVTMNIERDVHYRDFARWKRAVRVACSVFLNSLGLGG